MEAKIETKIEARRRLHIKAKTLPIGEGFVIVTSRFRATTRCRPMVFLLAFPKGKASHYRPVPPSSHRSFASVGFCRALHGLHCIPHARKRRACKYRVKAQPCFGRPHRVAPTMSVSKCGFPRAPTASEHALFSSLFLKEKHRFFGGSSFFPQKQSFCGSPISHPISKFAAIGIIFFLLCHPRIGSRLSLVLWERGGAGHKVNLRGKAAK